MEFKSHLRRNFSRFLLPGVVVWLIIIPALFCTWACEDVVQIETADAPTQMVVDAWLTNQPKSQTIRLSRSQPYFDNTFTEGISGAIVEVEVSTGEVLIFADEGSGNYVWEPSANESIGSIGDTFTLSIKTTRDQLLTAHATLFDVPQIDSIVIVERENDLRGPDGLYAEFFARDLPGLGNTYWIKAYKNGMFLNKPEEINLAFDAGFDAGAEIDEFIFLPPIRELINPVPDSLDTDVPPFTIGDHIRVEIHSINLSAFEFMTSVRDEILNGTNTIFATPIANAEGNVLAESGEKVLGIFNVAAVSSKERTVD